MTVWSTDGDRNVIPDHLGRYHGHCLALSRIHLLLEEGNKVSLEGEDRFIISNYEIVFRPRLFVGLIDLQPLISFEDVWVF